MRNVELVEAGEPLASEPDEAGTAPPTRRDHRRLWALGALVAVGALLVAGQQLLDHRHAAHVARFDDVPGVLAPLDQDLTEQWSYRGDRDPGGMDDAAQVGSHLLAGTVSVAERTYTIREVDRATGETVWSTSGKVDDATDLPQGSGVECRALDEARSSLAACSVGPYASGWPSEPDDQQIVVVDSTNGSVVGGLVGSWMPWAAGGGLLVTGASTTAADKVTWTLTAHDPSGKEVWRRELPAVDLRPDPEPDAEGVFDASQLYDGGLKTLGARVVLVEHGFTFVLDDGNLTASFDQGRGTRASIARGGQVVVSGDSGSSTRLLLPDGMLRTIAGSPIYTIVDDRSTPGVLLVQDDQEDALVAIDATTGAKRATVLAGWPTVVVLGGRAYAMSGSTLAAVDLATGERVWTATTPADGYQVFTDGRALYVDRSADSATVPLTAFAIDDGSPLPPVTLHADLRPDPDGISLNLFDTDGMLATSPDESLHVYS